VITEQHVASSYRSFGGRDELEANPSSWLREVSGFETGIEFKRSLRLLVF
jgi:hypothetical protein